MNRPINSKYSLLVRLIAGVVDVTILALALGILSCISIIVYANVAIIVGGTYEERIPVFWLELLILASVLALAVAVGILYFWFVRTPEGTFGKWIASRLISAHRSEDHRSAE